VRKSCCRLLKGPGCPAVHRPLQTPYTCYQLHPTLLQGLVCGQLLSRTAAALLTVNLDARALPGSCVPNFCFVCCICLSRLTMAALLSNSTSC
jgi:hypothetical protein